MYFWCKGSVNGKFHDSSLTEVLGAGQKWSKLDHFSKLGMELNLICLGSGTQVTIKAAGLFFYFCS